LDSLRSCRFVPVIFYSGYAEKLNDIETPIVRVVKKRSRDVESLRNAASEIFRTGLPSLIRHLEKEQKDYIWDTIDKQWKQRAFAIGPQELAYLLARRLAARLERGAIKSFLNHKQDSARAIERYIYPAIGDKIRTGCIAKCPSTGKHWLIATPACDFAQDKADNVLLVGATLLAEDDRFAAWRASKRWLGFGKPEEGDSKQPYLQLAQLMNNATGDRFRFLPGTFFIPDLVIDFQTIRMVPTSDLSSLEIVCQLDSPYREQFVLDVSRYYGHLGTPNLDTHEIFEHLKI
jgi:hypothetical protein